MDNVAYDCTLTYGICTGFGILYSFHVDVYGRSYFPVLPLKNLINEDDEPIMPFKLETGTKPSILHLTLLFCPCVVKESTANVGTKMLNMCHRAQKGICGIFVGIPQHQKRVSCLHTTHTEDHLFVRCNFC